MWLGAQHKDLAQKMSTYSLTIRRMKSTADYGDVFQDILTPTTFSVLFKHVYAHFIALVCLVAEMGLAVCTTPTQQYCH